MYSSIIAVVVSRAKAPATYHIIVNYIDYIGIPSDCMDKVISTLTIRVTITAFGDDSYRVQALQRPADRQSEGLFLTILGY